MIDVIGVPFDLCGKRLGSRLGPPALRLAGLSQVLQDLGLEVNDQGDLPSGVEDPRHDGGLRNFEPMMSCHTELKKRTLAAINRGSIPLVAGGDHSIAIGSVSAALEAYDGDLALVWIDAHADINTPSTSTTGNVHGMPIAALQGIRSGYGGKIEMQWGRILELVPQSRLRPDRCAWYGLRDVDPAERDQIRRTPGDCAITMQDVDRKGVVETMRQMEGWLRGTGATKLWISFDVDVLDPILAPGTGTAVRGGLSYRESHLCAELLREFLDAPDCPYQLVGVDVVETNPLFDTNNETAKMAVEWIGSLFGKSIMGVR